MNVGYTCHPPLPISPPASSPEPDESPAAPRKHVHRPLGPGEIRLLVLNPGNPDEPIACYLEHYPVANVKPFSALSYVWGAPAPSGGDGVAPPTILLDGRPVTVTPNLYAFLRAYRTEQTCPVLWVDAVCINQADLAERNAQIRLMKRLYEEADSIVIWLGESMPHKSATARAVRRMTDLYERWWVPRLSRERNSVARALASITAADIPDVLGGGLDGRDASDPAAAAWEGMRDIFSRPWWSRIWVYQEATAPCRLGAEVRIGEHSIPFEHVLTANQIVRHIAALFGAIAGEKNMSSSSGGDSTLGPRRAHLFSGLRDNTSKTSAYMQYYLMQRRHYHATGSSRFLKLADLLPALREFEATNPRDKLYALIPTSLDGAELLDVAYDKSVEQAYTSAAWSMIQKHGNLDVLGHCSLLVATEDESGPASVERRRESLDLPSWVPDWTVKGTPMPFFKRGVQSPPGYDRPGVIAAPWCIKWLAQEEEEGGAGLEIGKLYSASGGSTAHAASLDIEGQTLCCEGFLFDRIAHTSPSSGTTMAGTEVVAPWLEWLEALALSLPSRSQSRNSTPHSRSPFPASLRQTFAHTLVADCYRVAIDVGVRGCAADLDHLLSLSPTASTADCNDITGPHAATFRRRLVVTEKDYVGLVAETVKPGDRVAILMGSQVPAVLRSVEGSSGWRVIGEAYMHGIMDGEALGDGLEMSAFKIW
ncbi:heterokaryon incompatibility protein-domain-containing protein [Thelonectria olida]|uniref:Heterokaryon incompatibility protein-domain-containing protein n=1 Tax=Thelonectria olida TaxID=1576542 RepID=A0A9P9AII2_9HYPO|nr:heterokaryon incompatibility protein-domain-containing protein [Thelonectria olida]